MGLTQRFGALFDDTADRLVWDTVLARIGQYAVVPTKGSVVPRWLLVVPDTPVLNFAKLRRDEPLDILKVAADRLGVFAEKLIWFEHGACAPGTSVGCGVDHAHVHLLIAPEFGIDEFRAEVEARSGIAWTPTEVDGVYSSLDENRSYYVFGDQQDAWIAKDVNLGSQFFRKVVAKLAGKPGEWDYRAYENEANVAETLRYFVHEAA